MEMRSCRIKKVCQIGWVSNWLCQVIIFTVVYVGQVKEAADIFMVTCRTVWAQGHFSLQNNPLS